VHFEQESSEDEEEEDKEEGDEELVEDFEYEMLQEVAETMIAMTNHVSSAIDENNLFILISSGVEALQKAAFVLLKQLYENYIPTIRYKIDDSEMLLQIKQEAKE
jgi:cystathionine beta-lyase/cystathionine gamma-synthase